MGGVGRGSTNGLVLFKEIVLLDKKDLNIDRFMYIYRFYIHIA